MIRNVTSVTFQLRFVRDSSLRFHLKQRTTEIRTRTSSLPTTKPGAVYDVARPLERRSDVVDTAQRVLPDFGGERRVLDHTKLLELYLALANILQT